MSGDKKIDPAQTQARNRLMPDSVADTSKERVQNKRALEQSPKARNVKLNEGGRTTSEGTDPGNPQGSVEGVPRYELDEGDEP